MVPDEYIFDVFHRCLVACFAVLTIMGDNRQDVRRMKRVADKIMKIILYVLALAIIISTVSKITKEHNYNEAAQFGSDDVSIETVSAVLPAGTATEAMGAIDVDTVVIVGGSSDGYVLNYIEVD